MFPGKYDINNDNIVEKLKKSEKPIIDALNFRRTIRNYDNSFQIPKEQLDEIINAGRNAPTACNTQPFDFIVVKNTKKLDEVSDKILSQFPEQAKADFLKRKEKHGVNNVVTCDCPLVVIFVKNERQMKQYVDIDVGISAMAMMAAAIQYGYDSMCLGLFQNPAVEEYFNLPKGSVPLALAIGKVKGDRSFPHKELISKVSFVE